MLTLSKHRKWFWPLLIILLAVLVFVYLKSSKPQQQKPQALERAWPVEVVRVELQSSSPEQRLFGLVQSAQMIRYVAPISAQIDRVNKMDGEAFNPGEVLLALNDKEIELALSLARADHIEAQSALKLELSAQQIEKTRYQQELSILKLKQQDLQRNQELMQRNLASQSIVDQTRDALARQELAVMNAKLVVDQQQAKLAQIEARAERARANYEKAKLNAQRAIVRPDFHGRVASLHVAEGEQVNVNTLLLEAYPLASLELRATVPIKYQTLLQQALQKQTNIQAWYLDQFGRQHPLKLVRLAGQASASGLDGYFAIPESLAYVRPGEVVDVRLTLPEKMGFVVSYSALYGSDKVYIVDSEHRLQARQVKVLGDIWLNGRKLALVGGELKQGERVIITHLPNAIAGLLVSPTEVDNER